MDQPIILVGASTRAAAFSALRAHLRPWCVDLFGDVDLCSRCPTQTIAPEDYPAGLARHIRQAPPGPWMYTGALENRPALVRQLAHCRLLWGNDAPVLAFARSPQAVHNLLRAAGLPCPAIALDATAVPPNGRWLVKPQHGAGGMGISYWRGEPATRRRNPPSYFQEYIDGEACAAVYATDGAATHLLGVTRQLVGASWLHAAPFHYCGSVGPLVLAPPLREMFERLGAVLAGGCGLRGLFGTDCVLRDGCPWVVEVNPRYTASVEVMEYAAGFSALDWQRSVFDSTAGGFPSLVYEVPSRLIGKAILFAKAPLVFPADGPWLGTLQSPGSVHELPAFADIPPAGQPIAAGRPILTLFAQAGSPQACLDFLQRTTADLDRWLFRE
jgi:predicted ATP-grasp superfamily ATP-dependent carboligase